MVARQMTPEQIAEGIRLARGFRKESDHSLVTPSLGETIQAMVGPLFSCEVQNPRAGWWRGRFRAWPGICAERRGVARPEEISEMGS